MERKALTFFSTWFFWMAHFKSNIILPYDLKIHILTHGIFQYFLKYVFFHEILTWLKIVIVFFFWLYLIKVQIPYSVQTTKEEKSNILLGVYKGTRVQIPSPWVLVFSSLWCRWCLSLFQLWLSRSLCLAAPGPCRMVIFLALAIVEQKLLETLPEKLSF